MSLIYAHIPTLVFHMPHAMGHTHQGRAQNLQHTKNSCKKQPTQVNQIEAASELCTLLKHYI